MKAMILAAGKGERMMPLTKSTPKPLLMAGGMPLIEHHVKSLADAGISNIVVNTARFGEMIESRLGNGERWQIRITYSHEGVAPKGTGGGVQHALPLLGDEPFILINGDVWTDYDYRRLTVAAESPIHLVLVENPAHNLKGDFGLQEGKVSLKNSENRLTYSGIGLYESSFFRQNEGEMFSFVPALRAAINAGQVSGEFYAGQWYDIGTPERLDSLNALLSK